MFYIDKFKKIMLNNFYNISAIDSRQSVGTLFIDSRKAFDICVSHPIILKKRIWYFRRRFDVSRKLFIKPKPIHCCQRNLFASCKCEIRSTTRINYRPTLLLCQCQWHEWKCWLQFGPTGWRLHCTYFRFKHWHYNWKSTAKCKPARKLC